MSVGSWIRRAQRRSRQDSERSHVSVRRLHRRGQNTKYTHCVICDNHARSFTRPCIDDSIHTLQPFGPPFPVHPCERNIPLSHLLALPPLFPDRLQGRDNGLSVLLRYRNNYNQRRRDIFRIHHGLERVGVEFYCGGEPVPNRDDLSIYDFRQRPGIRTSTARA